MAGLKKIRSSTVLEATIALLLVLLVAGIAMVVFGRASVSGPSPAFIKAQEIVDSIAVQNTFENEEVTIDGLTISKEASPMENTVGWRLRFTITDRTGKLLEKQERILLVQQ